LYFVMETAEHCQESMQPYGLFKMGMVVGRKLIIGHAHGGTKSNFTLKSTRILTPRSLQVGSLGMHNVMHVRVLNVEHHVPTWYRMVWPQWMNEQRLGSVATLWTNMQSLYCHKYYAVGFENEATAKTMNSNARKGTDHPLKMRH